ncbi:NAD(P)-dependent oxidoreductase [Chitinophagaceae bacterium MMS25-I14]
MNKGKVLIAAPVHPVLTQGLTDAGYEYIIREKITQPEAAEIIKDCVGVVTSTRLQLNRELIDKAPELKWIGRMGSGMEVIDVPYATSLGIRCFSSPEGNCNAVAEHALGMLLGITKRIEWSHRQVQEGLWLRDENRGTELEGKTIGIIGYGHTGRAFARKLLAFDMNILAYDVDPEVAVQDGVTLCSLGEIYERAEIVSLHLPLRDDTQHYFNEAFLEKMQHPFWLINTSRGSVADLNAILHGLENGKILGACLDVLEGEPLEKMPEYLKDIVKKIIQLPQVIITPHIAGYSHEATYKMSYYLFSKIVMPE